MKVLKLIYILLLATFAACQAPAPKLQQPPVIDRELLFDNPEIAGGQLSPDGKFISFEIISGRATASTSFISRTRVATKISISTPLILRRYLNPGKISRQTGTLPT